MLTQFIILRIKDTSLESWAAQTIWSGAKKKYPSLHREQSALNAIVLGAEVHFAYGSWGTVLSDLAQNYGAAALNRSAVATGQPLMPQTREAWLRLTLPKKLKTRLRWLMQIHAARIGEGYQVVAQWGSTAEASPEGDDLPQGLLNAYHKEETVEGDDQVVSLVLSVRLAVHQYRLAYATVRVAAQREGGDDPLLRHGGMIIDEEHLTG